MECGVKDFIMFSYLEDTSVCDDAIEYFKKSAHKTPGYSGSGTINTKIKECTDVIFEDSLEQKKYLIELEKVANAYKEYFHFCDHYSPWKIIEGFNIQHYKPNQAFYGWHTERSFSYEPYNNRHLVFMTYLNDVFDEGETEFYYQKIKIQPRKGLTLIWPADWTHTHRGITSPTQEKYIITGWYNFYQGE